MSIDDVPYYNGSYNGDLIIIENLIYYFPHTDLTQDNIDRTAKSRNLALKILVDLASSLFTLTGLRGSNRSRIRKNGLWRDGDSCASLQLTLDMHISTRKEEKQPEMNFSSSLPLPERFHSDEVQNLTLSSTGVLSFEAHYDSHDFKVGLMRKGFLREALALAHFNIY
jgi:hypothetical protein